MTNQVEGITKAELKAMYVESMQMAKRGIKADTFLLILLTRCKTITIEPPEQPEEPLPKFLKPQAD